MPISDEPSRALRTLAVVASKIIALSFIVGVGAVAVLSAIGHVRLPLELHLLDQRLPQIFRIHMAASGLALILIAVTLTMRHRPPVHRPLGRLTAIMVAAGGLTAIPSAVLSEATVIARAGFLMQACVWLGLLGTGIAAIRSGNLDGHWRAMLAMAAVASGAIWLRFATMTAALLELPHDVVYGAAAWLCWLVPLLLTWRLAMVELNR